MNVLKRLNRTGHVNSVRGAHGGYVLKVRPEEFSLAALIEAVEGPVHLVRCSNPGHDDARPCTLTSRCFIRRAVLRVHKRMRDFLDGVTVAEIAREEDPTAALDTKLAQ